MLFNNVFNKPLTLFIKTPIDGYNGLTLEAKYNDEHTSGQEESYFTNIPDMIV